MPTIVLGSWFTGDSAAPEHCPLCHGAIVPVRGKAGVFRHRSALGDTGCVLTTHAYQPDEPTVRPVRDPRIFASHRRRFVDQWQSHYAVMQHLCPGLTFARFMAVLACADVLALWSYALLREEDLAMILLVLAGFMKQPAADEGTEADARSARWVRFWFDGSVSDIGDLWKARVKAPVLFRIDYRVPEATPFPTGAQVLSWMPVDGAHDAWARRLALPAAAIEPADRYSFARFASASVHEVV